MSFVKYEQKSTPCAGCEHYKAANSVGYGICLHKEGPTGKVFGKYVVIVSQEGGYPAGCPIDPDPPTPPRKRPGKKRGVKGNTKQVQEPKHEGMGRKLGSGQW